MYGLRRLRGKVPEEDHSLGEEEEMKRKVRQIVSDGFQLFYQDIKSARWAILLVIAYFAFLKKFLHSLCPAVLLTGFPCPGCGLTRAGFRVLRLDFAGAWRVHPFIFAIILLAVVFGAERYVRRSGKMTVTKWCGIAVILGMVVFYVWRMVKYFPDVPPMTYYHRNLLAGIFRR